MLAAVPLSMSKLNGEMRKTNEGTLLHDIELDNESLPSLSLSEIPTGYITDLMAVIQSSSLSKVSTFGNLSDILRKTILRSFKYANTVAVVPDRYDIPHSI